MATQVKHRRGNSTEIANFTPAIGEFVFNTDDNSVHVGDGVTQGGFKIKPNKSAPLSSLLLTEAINRNDARQGDLVVVAQRENGIGGGLWIYLEEGVVPIDGENVYDCPNISNTIIALVEGFGTENIKGYEVFDVNYDKPYRMLSDYEQIAGTTFGVAHTGQSLAEGGVGNDPVSGVNTPSFPERSMMFSPQPVAYSSNSLTNVTVDLVENTRVTIAHSLIRHLCTGNDNLNLFSGQAWGGKAYSEIKKGGATGVYEKVIQQVTNAKNIYDDIEYLGVTCVHGEQDALNGNTSYEADLVQWQNDYNTDIKAVTGQASDVPLYLCQTASGSGYGNNGGINETTFPSPLEQLAAHVNNNNIVMVCSKYHIPYADHSHITNLAQRILGEYYAKAFDEGISYEPLRPLNFSVNNNEIVITFSKSGLAFDTVGVAAATNNGFSYRDDSGNTINSIVITDTNEVTITLSGNIGANAVVGYAYHNGAGGAANQIAGLGDRGNLRDSDSAVSLYDGSPLYNWCVIFREELN